jgi:hypothetical protein
MPPRKPNWARKLSEPVKVIGRKAPIATLAEGREFILKLPAAHQGRNEWQYAAKLMIAAAEGGDVAAATQQLKFALLMPASLIYNKREFDMGMSVGKTHYLH